MPTQISLASKTSAVFLLPWQHKRVQLWGETLSLDDIEHDLIRGSGRYREPRIHFAVNCASLGCPALRPDAYSAERLEVQLEEQAQQFYLTAAAIAWRATGCLSPAF